MVRCESRSLSTLASSGGGDASGDVHRTRWYLRHVLNTSNACTLVASNNRRKVDAIFQ
jgi:hypothetical protein